MKIITCLFFFFGIIVMTVSGLPSPVRLSLNELQERSATLANSASFSARNDLFPRDNEPIFEEYFGRTLDITEREWEELTVEKRNVARVAKLIIKGVMKIVDLIKGRIQQDKDVRS